MNWYRKAMTLEPNAWQFEKNPARLRTHMPFDVTPYGHKVPQIQNYQNLEENYAGVHLTPSASLAAIYANSKATKNDPPVIIEIDPQGIPRELDVDAKVDQEFDVYFQQKLLKWKSIVESSADVDTKSEQLLNDLRHDIDMWQNDGEINDDLTDIVMREERSIPPVVIESAIEGKSPDQVVSYFQQMIATGPPKELVMQVIQQFRVMHPILAERVRAIYQIPWFDISTIIDDIDRDDDELREQGYVVKDGRVFNQKGQRLFGYEDIMYGEIIRDKQPIYVNRQIEMFPSNEASTWHGTTLSRAKKAFPELFPGRRKRNG